MDMHLLFIAIGGTAGIVKIFLMLARSMPPPRESCGFLYRWFYDFFQLVAENQDRVGKVQDPTQPVGVARQTVDIGAVTANLPPTKRTNL
jgi:hypothetical protein